VSTTYCVSYDYTAAPLGLPSFPTRRSSDLPGSRPDPAGGSRGRTASPPTSTPGPPTPSAAPTAPPRSAGSAGGPRRPRPPADPRSEEHTSELQSRVDLVCRLLLEKKKNRIT